MKKTLVVLVALGACAGTQLFAQNSKEDVITFNLTRQYQSSVSDSTSKANNGLWTAPPTVYKTKSTKLTTTDVLRSIGVVLHQNANAYSSKAKLVLVQGELTGFFGLQGDPNNNPLYTNTVAPVYTNHPVTPAYTNYVYWNTNTPATNVSRIYTNATPPWIVAATNPMPAVMNTIVQYGVGKFYAGGSSSSIGDMQYRLATGRHFQRPSDVSSVTDTRLAPGHDQPWGQVFVKDPGAAGYSSSSPLCENVTFFFRFDVQECYDCFYLSSFVSDSTFKFSARQGPPCCAGSTANSGSGKDKYFMYLSFDNTVQNPYLDDSDPAGVYVGWTGGLYPGIVGLYEADNGVDPDALPYDESIINQVSNPADFHDYDIYVMRFTLEGILTYSWNLKLLNSTDVAQEFVGSGSYPAYGYGYIAKVCSLLTGSASFSESVKKQETCCLDRPWYNSWYGIGYPNFDYNGTSEVNFPTSLTYHDVQNPDPNP